MSSQHRPIKRISNGVNIANELREKLREAVQRNVAEGLLFSGGLDTSILAVLDPNMNPAPRFWMPRRLWQGGKRGGVKAITVSLESFGKDAPYAESVAKGLKLSHYHRRVSIDEAMDSIPDVIRILKIFDPAIPNDLVVYFGLKRAKEMGIREVMTGDGSDELFGGYSFMEDIDDLGSYIQKISEKMSFSSNKLSEFFGIKIIQPFIDKNIIDFALQLPADLKIRKYNGKVWGKWILRKAFEELLPAKIIWQDKRPLESGSGMTKIRETISSKVCDEEFEKVNKSSSIKFINKEHFYYYKIYKKVIGKIPKPNKGEKKCQACGAGLERSALHCKICGYVGKTIITA